MSDSKFPNKFKNTIFYFSAPSGSRGTENFEKIFWEPKNPGSRTTLGTRVYYPAHYRYLNTRKLKFLFKAFFLVSDLCLEFFFRKKLKKFLGFNLVVWKKNNPLSRELMDFRFLVIRFIGPIIIRSTY